MTDDTEFGYKVTESKLATTLTLRPVYYVCENCGSDDVEKKWFCAWNVDKQAWVPCDDAEEDPYCNNCGGNFDIEERKVGT